MGELFRGRKDERAAEEEALDILKPSTPNKKEITKIVRLSFRRVYSEVKFTLVAIESPKKPEGFLRTGLINHIKSYISDAKRRVADCLSDKNEKKIAENLGCALGYFLGSVDYGIVTITFSREADDGVIRVLLNYTQDIAKYLKELNKTIDPVFLRNRLIRIGKKHRDDLNDVQRKLLANMAAILR